MAFPTIALPLSKRTGPFYLNALVISRKMYAKNRVDELDAKK
jgi:hypothetical protein